MARTRNATARRRFVQALGLGTAIGVGTTAVTARDDSIDVADDTEASQAREETGLVTVESAVDFETTVARLEDELEQRELVLVTTVDHAANAAEVDEQLPPTTLFLFGNPEVGTPLMQASRSIGIDLPQKFLVWEDDGDAFVTYNDPQFLADRHDLEGVDEQLEGIAGTLEELATAITQAE